MMEIFTLKGAPAVLEEENGIVAVLEKQVSILQDTGTRLRTVYTIFSWSSLVCKERFEGLVKVAG
jgi:hypothetical protein